jgi:hypothetical protein
MDHNDTIEALSKTTTAVNGVLLGDIKKNLSQKHYDEITFSYA